MAKISSYPSDAALNGTELIPSVQGSETSVVTPSQIAEYAFEGWGAANAADARAAIGAGVGSVTSVAAANATGITWAGSPITGSGTLTPTLSANLQAWHGLATSAKQDADTDLTAVAALASNGIAARTGSGTWAVRSIAQPAAGVTVTNGDGVSGNPTLALANDLAAVEGLSTSGSAHRIGTDSWAVRTLTGTASRVTVTNGNGVSGNPTVDIDTTFIPNPTTYTPTITNVANVTTSTAKACQYFRIGSVVHVSGQVDVTPTAGAASTTIGISLPIASALSASEQCAGTACEGGTGQYAPGAILADSTNDRASLVFKSVSAGAVHAMLFAFTYRII